MAQQVEGRKEAPVHGLSVDGLGDRGERETQTSAIRPWYVMHRPGLGPPTKVHHAGSKLCPDRFDGPFKSGGNLVESQPA
jgi:hypothetical protein